jgi:hypothetical protein
MKIHNLPAKHKALLDVMWEMDEDQVVSFVKSLPYKDMRDIGYLLEVVHLGGDEITDVGLASEIIDRIRRL